MEYRPIYKSDVLELHALWNEFTREKEVLYKEMSLSDIQSKFLFHENFDIYTIGAFLDGKLVGFSSGVHVEGQDTAYITLILVKQEYRKQGIGRELLQHLESELICQPIIKIDIVFFNPVSLEWIVPNTDHCIHPGAPGIDKKSDAYPFLIHKGYYEYVFQNTYYRNIETYEYTDQIKHKIEKLNEQGIFVDYYHPDKHHGFDELFDDLNSETWRTTILNNIQREDGGNPVLIVHRNGEICGFTGPLRRQDNGRGYFAGIGIHSNCRGVGAGAVLFSALCLGLKELGAEYMTLFTGDNNPARIIYEKEGFEIVRSWANLRKKIAF